MKPRKKLIEVALPLEAINEEASRRKRKAPGGYPTTLHKWWAQRPLAACRAVLFASLVDDPVCDPEMDKLSGETREHAIGVERERLHEIIRQLILWENSKDPDVLNRARAEIARCVASRKIETGEWAKEYRPVVGGTAGDFALRRASPDAIAALLADHSPPVSDPFCGGGSIPLEAQRLGLRTYASDLNPVSVLITKALIEIQPKFTDHAAVNPESRRQQTKHADWSGAKGLAEDVRYYGRWIRAEAERQIGHLFPKVKVTPEMAQNRSELGPYVGQELTVIAWLWARTVASPNPAAGGAHVPLVSSYMLSLRSGKRSWVEVVQGESGRDGWSFVVRSGELTRQAESRARSGSKAGKAEDFICALTGQPIARS